VPDNVYDIAVRLRERRRRQVDAATELYADLRAESDTHLRLNSALLREKLREIREDWDSNWVRPFDGSSELATWLLDYHKVLAYVERNCPMCQSDGHGSDGLTGCVLDVVLVACDRNAQRLDGGTADGLNKQLGSATARRRLAAIVPGADKRARQRLAAINTSLLEVRERLRSVPHRSTYNDGRDMIWYRCNLKGPSDRRYLLREW